MTAHKSRVAWEMYRSGQYTVAAIAKTLGVSRAFVYRHLTGDIERSAPRDGHLWPPAVADANMQEHHR